MARGPTVDNEANGRDDATTPAIIAVPRAENRILLIRGQKVILDSDLAELYGVETRTLVQAVKRNRVRFPGDFLFQLSAEEFQSLRSHSVISNGRAGRGGRRYPPYAFTEHGAIMAAGISSIPSEPSRPASMSSGPSSASARCSPRTRASPPGSDA